MIQLIRRRRRVVWSAVAVVLTRRDRRRRHRRRARVRRRLGRNRRVAERDAARTAHRERAPASEPHRRALVGALASGGEPMGVTADAAGVIAVSYGDVQSLDAADGSPIWRAHDRSYTRGRAGACRDRRRHRRGPDERRGRPHSSRADGAVRWKARFGARVSPTPIRRVRWRWPRAPGRAPPRPGYDRARRGRRLRPAHRARCGGRSVPGHHRDRARRSTPPPGSRSSPGTRTGPRVTSARSTSRPGRPVGRSPRWRSSPRRSRTPGSSSLSEGDNYLPRPHPCARRRDRRTPLGGAGPEVLRVGDRAGGRRRRLRDRRPLRHGHRRRRPRPARSAGSTPTIGRLSTPECSSPGTRWPSTTSPATWWCSTARTANSARSLRPAGSLVDVRDRRRGSS